MTDKEKLAAIKAEIERLRHDWPKVISDDEKNHLWMYFRGLNRMRDFIDSLPEEPVSEDLEKAAEEEASKYLPIESGEAIGADGEIYETEDKHWQQRCGFINGFKAGAQWQKEQLMKNVVLEAEVLRDSDGDGVDTPYESWLTLADTDIPELPESLGLEEGDKVKVIVIKED